MPVAADPIAIHASQEETPVIPELPPVPPPVDQEKPAPPAPVDSSANIDLSSTELKSLADTVASLETTTQEAVVEESQAFKPRPIGEVIESLLNRKSTEIEAEPTMGSSVLESKNENKSALGMDLDLSATCSTEGVLDRLESKFASSNGTEKDSDSSRMSTMEANLAKAYSHFLQASENRKRQAEENDMHIEDIPPKVNKSFLGDGLGISLDMDYDLDLMIKKKSPSFVSNSPSPVKSNSSPIRGSYQPPEIRTLGSGRRSPISRRTLGGTFDHSRTSPISSLRDLKDPYYHSRGSPDRYSPPRRHNSRHNSPEMDNAFDDDRLSSSPEAPNLIDDDFDEMKPDFATANTNFRKSPRDIVDDSPSFGDTEPLGSPKRPIRKNSFEDKFEGSSRGRSFSPPLSLSLNSESSSSWNHRLPRNNLPQPSFKRKLKYCNKDDCTAKFERQYPEYYEHYKSVHGIRNGVPCAENKCSFIARGPENLRNHIKARHPDTL